MPKVGLISLGCAKNLVDSEQMLALLQQAGWEVTDNMAQADVGIINTCGFIESAKNEAIMTILEVSRYKQNGSMKGLVVTGCLVQRYWAEIQQELPEVDVLCGTGSYHRIVEAVQAAWDGQPAAYMDDIRSAALEGKRQQLTPFYTAYLKIAEGCSNRCAYCVIPQIRGPYRSRPFDALLQEARGLAERGVKELIVIAQDITRYGMDLSGHQRQLPALLRALCELDFQWIRLHYLYPDQITEELIAVIASEPKIVKYLDIPLQHVSRRILRAMHRPGDAETFTTLIRTLRERIPGLVLRTSLIVGLPGETVDEFAELCDFLREVQLERVGVFAYSPEENTEAAAMPDQIDDTSKNERQRIIEELQEDIMERWNQTRCNTVQMVLTEGYDVEQGCYVGRTYADSIEVDSLVYFTSEHDTPAGALVPVYITNNITPDLFGVRKEEAEDDNGQ